MPKKLPPKALNQLSDIGADEHEDIVAKYRGAIPESLTDVLIQNLRPRARTALAKKLIKIALDDKNPRVSLEAIKEIYDRIEGRAVQSIRQSRAADDPLLSILQEAFKDEPLLVAPAINSGYRILNESTNTNNSDEDN